VFFGVGRSSLLAWILSPVPIAYDDHRVTRIRLSVVIASALVALVVIVPWADFQGHTHWDEVGWIPFVSWPVRNRDIVVNLLLCAPLGIASALYFRSHVLAAGLIAFGVSLFGEWLQVYSHSRFPSATDLLCNVAGAVAAALVVRRRLQQGPP
jgi:glycopeptide antibiotics resistance protein